MKRVEPRLPNLVRRLVVARRAARLAVHQTVVANADVNCRLAETAKLLAFAGALRLLALRASIFRSSSAGAHNDNVACPLRLLKMTFVIVITLERCQAAMTISFPAL
jgi:hypothetical protein